MICPTLFSDPDGKRNLSIIPSNRGADVGTTGDRLRGWPVTVKNSVGSTVIAQYDFFSAGALGRRWPTPLAE